MSRLRILILLFAVACAVLAAVLTRGRLTQEQVGSTPVVSVRQDSVPVLVAARDMAIGERLTSLSVAWRDWPRDNLLENMITRDNRPDAIEELQQGRVRFPLSLGEPILDRKIIMSEGKGFLSGTLAQGMRAVSVAISEQTAANGFILPNDRVDVILTRAIDTGNQQKSIVSRTIIGNVRVLAINEFYGQEDDKVNLTDIETALLELEPEQAEALARAEAQGDISLALRSIAEGGNAGEAGERPVLAQSPRADGSTPAIIRYGFRN